MTCSEAIARVVLEANRPMRAVEIADEINQRGLYIRGDGRPLPAYQVSSVAHGSPRFRVVGGMVGLHEIQPTAAAQPPQTVEVSEDASCVLIGCVSRKEPTARQAKDLYRTTLFSRRRAYAEASGKPWLIVSALHGIVDPEQVIEPYDVRLADLAWAERHRLADRVGPDLEARFGPLENVTFEVHAGAEYMHMLTMGLRPYGVQLTNPLRGLRIGEQLAWYGRRPGHSLAHPASVSVMALPDGPPRQPGLAKRITAAFQAGALDLSLRAGAPAAGWSGMPEVLVADRMRTAGASDRDVRLLLTFTAAMDRARDADALWFAAERLFEAEPWTIAPQEVLERSLTDLADTLRRYGVSQRHRSDSAAWRVIAESLADPGTAPAVSTAVIEGRGDARELLQALQAQSPGGTDRFPFLRGPKVGPMWVRMLAHPGGGTIRSIDVLPVAVDVQVRKITEYLAVTDTGGLDLDAARPIIQAAWAGDVSENGAEGPPALDGTAAALDPALWFWAKWGCTRCERAGERLPIAGPCEACRYPTRSS